MKEYTKILGRYAAELKYEALPASAIEQAKTDRKPVFVRNRNSSICRKCSTNRICTGKAEVVADVLRRLHIPEEEKDSVIMVGDRKHDVEGAAAHGIRTIAVTFGYGSVEELTTVGAWKLAHTMEELTALLLEA